MYQEQRLAELELLAEKNSYQPRIREHFRFLVIPSDVFSDFLMSKLVCNALSRRYYPAGH